MSAGFIRLLDNYEKSSGVAELVTAEELIEINLFLDAVLETAVMKVCLTCCYLHLMSYLHFSSSYNSFCSMTPYFLHDFIWISDAILQN